MTAVRIERYESTLTTKHLHLHRQVDKKMGRQTKVSQCGGRQRRFLVIFSRHMTHISGAFKLTLLNRYMKYYFMSELIDFQVILERVTLNHLEMPFFC